MLLGLLSFWNNDAPEALIEAVKKKDNLKEINRLITKKHDVNYVQDLDLNKQYPPKTKAITALFSACELGQTEYARLLLNAGADSNFSSVYGTPLLSAAHCLKPELIQLLLKHKADVNQKGVAGTLTPLIMVATMACIHGANMEQAKQCLQILLAAGADMTAKDGTGKTAQDVILEGGKAVAELLPVFSEKYNAEVKTSTSAMRLG